MRPGLTPRGQTAPASKSLEDIAKPHGVIAWSAEGIFRSGDPRQGGVAAGD
jgi:hypothetical protein